MQGEQSVYKKPSQSTLPEIVIRRVANGIIFEEGQSQLVYEVGEGRKAAALRDLLRAVQKALIASVGALEVRIDVRDPVGKEPAAATHDPAVMFTTEAVASRYGISKRSLEAMRAEGNGPVYYEVGRRVLYRCEDVDAWLAMFRVATGERNG